MGLLLFPVGEEWFSRLMRIPSGIFGTVKLMKFQCPFTLGSQYDIAYLVFCKSSQVSAKHGFASVFKNDFSFIIYHWIPEQARNGSNRRPAQGSEK